MLEYVAKLFLWLGGKQMKKKFAIGSIIMLLLFGLTGCGCEHEYDDGTVKKEPTCTVEGEKTYTCTLCEETKIESISLKEHTYKDTITKEPTFEEEGEKTFKCEYCEDSYTESIPVRDDQVVVTVTNKSNLGENWDAGRYSDRVEFAFEIKNRTENTVKGVQGILKISDLFGVEILSINCDFTGYSIKANGSISVTDLGMDINEFMDSHVKIYNTAYSDLKFEYEVTNIVYGDGSSTNETTVEATENQKVIVQVTDKKNLEENWDAGRYSPRVEFLFKVFNKTSKDIKGVQGILTVKDLFGVDIMSSTLDFTGETIKANGSINVSGMGLDINQFMDEHVELYTTDFEDLKFEYEVTAIVYSDGTTE